MTLVQLPGASIDATEVRERFAAAMRQRGLIPPPELITDGKIHRCDVRGKRGKNDGSYLLFTTGKLPGGGFQNFTDGLGWQNWHYDLGRQLLTPVEQREIQERQAAAARERAELEKLDIAAAAQRAHNIWSRTWDVAGHGYLAAKQIGTSGARLIHGALVIPARTIDGELRGLQFIAADGKKRWMKGSRPTGTFYQIGGDRSISEDTGATINTVVICEGFATAATIHEATGYIVVAAFSCGNLNAVAEAVSRKHPDTKIIIGADDDHETKGNPGIYAALDAALAVDGLLASPGFDQPLAAGTTDFNDVALSRGLDSVRKAIKAAGTPAEVLERRLLQDPFWAFDPESIKAVVKLKERDQSAFERLRERLKQKGARTSELDKLWARAAISDIDGVERTALKQADILVKLAGSAHLFHTRDGTAYADITVADHRETCAIYSRDFKRWLKHRYYEQTESSPGSETFTSALGTIEAKAIYEGPEQEVHVRTGSHGGNIYIDIGDADWRAIEVTAADWCIISNPPIRFRRPGTMLPLPAPVSGGKIGNLRKFLNVPSDDAFILAVAFILAAMRPEGPYPVLSLHGPAGTAKSTFSEVMRRLVDPGKPALRSLPREKEDFFIAANNNHLLAFENISFIPTWTSDLMCQLSTGGGHSRREPYTAMDETTFDAQKPQVLNGIEDFVIRGDLADRAVPLVLQTIQESKRRHERAFWAEFDSAAPLILGALLDALSNGLRNLATTELKVLPRMADFAIWATACETGAPWVANRTFAQAYAENRAEATAVVLEDDTVAQALRKFMATLELWKGRAAELLAELTSGWNGDIPEKWPKAGNKLSNRLRRVMPQLSAIGLQVTIGKTSDKSHHAVITVEKVGPSDDGGSRPEADQVAPPVSSEILLPSENPGNQGCSQVSRTAEVAGDLLPPEDGFDAQGVASGVSSSEHRTISEDNGGGTLRKASPCSNCGVSDADVQTKHASFPDLPPFLDRRPDRSAPPSSSPDEPGEEGEVYENE